MRFCFSEYILGGQSLVTTSQELSLLFVLCVSMGVGGYRCVCVREAETDRQMGDGQTDTITGMQYFSTSSGLELKTYTTTPGFCIGNKD